MDFIALESRQKAIAKKYSLLMRNALRMKIRSMSFKERKRLNNWARLRKITNTKTKVKYKYGMAEAIKATYPGQLHFVETGTAGKVKYAPRQILDPALQNPLSQFSDELVELYADTLLDTSKELENG